jgi:hypothetical protein
MIFAETLPFERKLTAKSIQELRTERHDKRLTGLMCIDLGKNGLLYLFHNQGQEAFAFLRTESEGRIIPPENTKDLIGQTAGFNVRDAVLALPALRICKLAIFHLGPGSTSSTTTGSLPNLLEKWREDKDACFARVRWNEAEGLAFFNGESWSPSVLFSSIENRTGDYRSLFSSQPEASCEVTRFIVPQYSDAWQEYHLQQAFASICKFMFKRYEEFTGMGLVQSVIWMMSETAAAEQLNVKVGQLQLEDLNLFPGPEKAAHAYRLLLRRLTGRIRALLGPALLNSITADAAFELSPCQRTAANMHRLLELGITIPILRETRGIT